ncbi:beta/gamma crystallin domain-containing protein [Bacillus thuringiensis]|uniref:beta/gamma crystallin domain-containing protein n=1 Tax=Bacillus thuringiensis TaxID=1428 RepID=UPI00115CBA3E|nr:beta/gamma crystallin domain-containing protein [Bacillus thuringiensis]
MFYDYDLDVYDRDIYDPNTHNNLNQRAGWNTFYEHINGEGASFSIYSGEYKPFVGNWWNDKISSVLVAPRTLVILYEHINFTGRKKNLFNYKYSSPHLFNIHRDFNDIVSSIKTIQLA